jgi:tetratricopeptide (TPR) repeat protein
MVLIAQEAISLGHEGDWLGCVLAWDDILRSYPDYGDGYYGRSVCYLGMARGQRSLAEFEDYIRQALEDIDRAIALSDEVTGDYYYQRFRVYDDWSSAGGSASFALVRKQLALENLQQALARGTGWPTAHRSLPLCMIVAGHCAEGLAEAQRLLDAIEPGDAPSGSINRTISMAYLCLGRYDEALQSVRTALAISDVPLWRYQEAVILYSLGRLDEARLVMDDLISADPYFEGYRYYLRALIHYDQGHPELAEQDLWAGAQNVWGIDHIGALVSGLLARDAGREDEAVAQLSWAVASISYTDGPFLDRAVQELRSLGVEAPAVTPTPDITATPMPTVTAPPPGGMWATPAGEELEYASGSGLLHISPGGHMTIHFVPRTAVDVVEATELTITVELEGDERPTDLKIFVWQPETNIWTMFNYEGLPIQVGNPGRFVLPDGGLVLAPLENGDGSAVLNILVHLDVKLADGSLVTLGVP